ncbi:MAG: hypothetical protein AAGB22_08125, partial [Bacteroidota bacterium]
MSKLEELKDRVEQLESLLGNIDNVNSITELFNDYWPKLKSVLECVESMKITGRRADKKLNAAIEAGDKIYATTSDPTELAADVQKLKGLLEEIDDKLDKVIAILTFIDKLFREDTKVDNLIDTAV